MKIFLFLNMEAIIMWVYLLLLFVVFILLLLSSIYLVRLTHNAIKKYINNKLLSWILSFIPIFLFIIGFFIDLVNSIVVDIHLIIIVFLVKIIFGIIKKISKKTFSEYIILTTGIIITSLILTRGYYLAHHVEETYYEVYTEKELKENNFRIVQISDSHLGATMTGKDFSKYMEDINKLNPDIVVVTGDFVDDDTPFEYMKDGADGLGKLKTKYGVYFIYGNHDKGYYNKRSYNDNDIRRELTNNNVKILED